MQTAAAPFVLVHGAHHGGWCWDALTTLLEPHPVFAPTLTGLSERQHEYHRSIDLQRHTQDIVDVIEEGKLSNVHLVGWSYGGMVITGVFSRIPARISAVTYIDAYLPSHGEAATSALKPVEKGLLRLVSLAGIGLKPPSPAIWGVTDPDEIEAIGAHITPQPPRTLTQKVIAPEPWPAHIRYSYIWCKGYRDSIFGSFCSKAKQDNRFDVFELPGSHYSAVNDAASVAKILLSQGS